MRNGFVWLLLALAWTGCGLISSDPQETGGNGDATYTPPPDSLQQVYQDYYAQLPDTFPLQCRPEAGKVNPADEAPRDTAFFIFREYLREVVAERDIFKLLPLIDEDIKIGFGAEAGLADFIRMWDLTDPAKVPQSRLWTTLAEVLDLGGAFTGQGDYFEAPYLGACWPAEADPYTFGAITGAGVRLRSAPSLQSQIRQTLSYDLVEYLETTEVETAINGRKYPWIKVKTAKEQEGYVYGQFFRLPIDFRAGFSRDADGKWRMVTLLAGD
jgi:hypothetical protein